MAVTLVVGTEKGGFVVRSDTKRETWKVEGPFFKGWKVTTCERDAQGRFIAGVTSNVYGATVQISKDLKKWTQATKNPAWPAGGTRKMNQIWRIFAGPHALLAGVDDAGLFASTDGLTWAPVDGLNEHPTRAGWQPGAGGNCAHSILVDPMNPQRAWVGISAVGVFRTDDGGGTWATKNVGIPVILADKKHKDIGY